MFGKSNQSAKIVRRENLDIYGIILLLLLLSLLVHRKYSVRVSRNGRVHTLPYADKSSGAQRRK